MILSKLFKIGNKNMTNGKHNTPSIFNVEGHLGGIKNHKTNSKKLPCQQIKMYNVLLSIEWFILRATGKTSSKS